MALRTYRASDGTVWNVWRIKAGTIDFLPNGPTEWLAFQNEEGTDRRRLMQVPADWFELSDERLELLRRVAEPVARVTHMHSLPGGTEKIDPTRLDRDR